MGVSAYFGGALIYPNSSSVVVKMNRATGLSRYYNRSTGYRTRGRDSHQSDCGGENCKYPLNRSRL